MTFLLDTNVVSEWAAPRPSPRVQNWLNTLEDDSAFISSVTVAEVARGILLLPAGKRRARLSSWFENDLLDRFAERCLPVRTNVALRWADLMADAQSTGRSMDALDGFIAATAAVHGLVLATRNTRHFTGCGIPLVDPWAA